MLSNILNFIIPRKESGPTASEFIIAQRNIAEQVTQRKIDEAHQRQYDNKPTMSKQQKFEELAEKICSSYQDTN